MSVDPEKLPVVPESVKFGRRPLIAILGTGKRIEQVGAFLINYGRVFQSALQPSSTPDTPTSDPKAMEPKEKPAGHTETDTNQKPDPYKRVKPVDSIEGSFNEAERLALTVENPAKRYTTLANIGISRFHARRSTVDINIMILPNQGTYLPEQWMAGAKFHRGIGSFRLADIYAREAGKVDLSWHLETAEFKADLLKKATAPDARFRYDPTPDLDDAKKLLTHLDQATHTDVIPYARYVEAHVSATDRLPLEPYGEKASELFVHQLPSYRKYSRLTQTDALAAEALARARFASGNAQGAEVVLDVLSRSTNPMVIEPEVRAWQFMAQNSLKAGIEGKSEADLKTAARFADSALKRIATIDWGKAGWTDLSLLVRPEMKMIKVVSGYHLGNPSWREDQYDVAKTIALLNPSTDIPPDWPLEATAWRVYAKYAWKIGETYGWNFNDAKDRLDRAWNFQPQRPSAIDSLTLGYRTLIRDYTDHGLIGEAKLALEKLERYKGDKGPGTARYAEALAEIACAEAKEVHAEQGFK